ncbi:MAG: hypothetical protein AB1439_00705 [candidate division FCPU426 bacterium]
MKKAVSYAVVLTCLLGLAASAPAAAAKAAKTPKAVNYKTLQAILPTLELAGFKRLPVEGSTDTAFGMSMSFASVTYEKGGDENLQTIEVRIEDNAATMNYGGVDMSEMASTMMQGMEAESDAGYYKNVTIQGFQGSERVERGESPTAEIVILVAKRFTVKLTANGMDDVALLQRLVNKMDLAKLAKSAK